MPTNKSCNQKSCAVPTKVCFRFNLYLTKHKTNGLKSDLGFKYKATLSKFKTYREWRCVSRDKTKCRGRFCSSLDDKWYWKHNPHHTCVNPPQYDLTPQEEEQQRQIVADVLLTKPNQQLLLPKTKAITKGTNYNQKNQQLKNDVADIPQPTFKVQKATVSHKSKFGTIFKVEKFDRESKESVNHLIRQDYNDDFPEILDGFNEFGLGTIPANTIQDLNVTKRRNSARLLVKTFKFFKVVAWAPLEFARKHFFNEEPLISKMKSNGAVNQTERELIKLEIIKALQIPYAKKQKVAIVDIQQFETNKLVLQNNELEECKSCNQLLDQGHICQQFLRNQLPVLVNSMLKDKKNVKISVKPLKREELIPFGKLTQPILKEKADPLLLLNKARLEVQDMRGKMEDLEQENILQQKLSQQLKKQLDELLSAQKQLIVKQTRDESEEIKENNIQRVSDRLKSLRSGRSSRSQSRSQSASRVSSDTDMTVELSIEDKKHARLTKSYPSDATLKRAKILDKKNLSEEQLHHQFIERMRYYHKLSLTFIDWSFIEDYPILKQGKPICDNFVDGHLYSDGLCTGLSKQELEYHMNKVYSKHGLHLFKVDSRKTQPNFTGGAESKRGWFVKFNDNANDFTIRRITDLQAAVSELQHPLLKLDVTSDCEGCLFVPNPKSLNETKLACEMKKLGFQVKRNFIQFPTCVCFEKEDISVNFYNKPVQRFEADTLYDKIGNGLQTILGSEAMARKFLVSKDVSFFRIEVRYNFQAQGQISFSKRKAKDLFENTNKMLNKLKELAYKSGLVHKVPIHALWEGLWTQIQSYFIIVSKQFTTLIYGQNQHTSKYMGAQWTSGKNRMNRKFVEKLVKVYGIVGKQGYVVRFQDKDRYHLQEWDKLEGVTALPLRTLFKDNSFTSVHLNGKRLADFGLRDVGVIKFSP